MSPLVVCKKKGFLFMFREKKGKGRTNTCRGGEWREGHENSQKESGQIRKGLLILMCVNVVPAIFRFERRGRVRLGGIKEKGKKGLLGRGWAGVFQRGQPMSAYQQKGRPAWGKRRNVREKGSTRVMGKTARNQAGTDITLFAVEGA